MTETEHREYIESALRRIDEVEAIPDDPNDPSEEQWMRGIDAMRPHRPLFWSALLRVQVQVLSPALVLCHV
jgi:hypothetical protein